MMVQSAVRPAADTALLQVAHGYELLGQGRMDAALAAAEAALAAEPELVDGLLLRGAALKAAGRYGEAIAAFEAALARDPGRAAARVSLANAQAELGELSAAEANLVEALLLAPRLKAAHASLITVCALLKRDDLTEAACRRALEVDPHAVNAHQHLAAILARRGETEAAAAHREAAYRRQNLFVEPATRPAPVALVLVTAEDGNVPLRYLLSRDRYTVIKWLIEYATPEQVANLPRHDVVFNAIGEPELPAATHAAVEQFRQGCAVRFVNRPGRVARTRRVALPELFAGIPDVVVPQVTRWEGGAPPAFGWPLLVRPVGTHGGAGLVQVADAAEFSAAAGPLGTCDVTAFHDFASADGLFRKYRAIFIDRRPYPYHLAIGDRWLVHYITANMLGEPARRTEERRFVEDPEGAIGARAWAALVAIGARLDLDYGGIDFSVLPDGQVLMFEANATMVVHPEAPDSVLAYKNPAVAAILAAFDAMAVPERISQ